MFCCMPFGLKNAPAVFQCLAEIMIEPLKKFALIYIDDILIFSDTYEEHVEHLKLLCARLKEFALVLNVTKSKFFQTSVHFLGLEFSAAGYRPPADYVPKIEHFKRPVTRKGVQ